jgi:hypothetical protein
VNMLMFDRRVNCKFKYDLTYTSLCYPLKGGFFQYFIQHCFICRPSDSTMPENAGIEPRIVATSALAVRRSITTRLDLIHNSARSHPLLG